MLPWLNWFLVSPSVFPGNSCLRDPTPHSFKWIRLTFHCLPDTFDPKTLETSKFVFVRHDAHRTPLRLLYDSLFRVLESGQKHFVLDFGGWRETVCVDRVKPANLHMFLRTKFTFKKNII